MHVPVDNTHHRMLPLESQRLVEAVEDGALVFGRGEELKGGAESLPWAQPVHGLVARSHGPAIVDDPDVVVASFWALRAAERR